MVLKQRGLLEWSFPMDSPVRLTPCTLHGSYKATFVTCTATGEVGALEMKEGELARFTAGLTVVVGVFVDG